MTTPVRFDDAYTMVQDILRSWGLTELFPDARDMLTRGDAPEVVPFKLRETDAYKRRFKANDDRRKAGIRVLSEAEFLQTEDQYKRIVARSGVDSKYYSREFTDRWIAGDVAPTELNERMEDYRQRYLNSSAARDWVASGSLTPKDILETILDPTIDDNTLSKRMRAMSIGGEALAAFRGDYVMSQDRAIQLAERGVDTDDARKGFQDLAAREANDQQLARMAGDNLTRENLEDEALGLDSQTAERLRRARQQEAGRFGANYLGVNQGALSRESRGQY